MKRDFNLIREILLDIEKREGDSWSSAINVDGYPSNQITYHIKMLCDKGLIECKDISTLQGTNFLMKNLTFEGHDFLDAIREKAVWNKTCKYIKDKGGAFTLDIIKEVAMLVVRDNLGL